MNIVLFYIKQQKCMEGEAQKFNLYLFLILLLVMFIIGIGLYFFFFYGCCYCCCCCCYYYCCCLFGDKPNHLFHFIFFT